MQEEDYKVLRNEADAEPDRYTQWDPSRKFQSDYAERHKNDLTYDELTRAQRFEEQGHALSNKASLAAAVAPPKEEEVAPLSRQTTISSSSSSSATSASAHSARLEEIRTATPARERPTTATSQTSSRNILQLHPTERHPEAIRRIETHRSQHAGTVGAAPAPSRLSNTLSRRRTEKPLPSLGAGKPFPPPLPDREEYVVEFDGADDPMHAQNWPMKKKLVIGAILSFDALAATMGSSIFSAAIGPVSSKFGVIREVGTLGTSLFVFGYAFGPLIWAPWSELYGRKPPVVIAALGFSIFSIAVAVAKDLQTVLICRFFAGLFGSSPLAIVAAVFADMFDNKVRGLAIAVFSATVFMGPLLAPFIGGFITSSYLGWRWTEYISSFMGFASFALLLLFMEETYPPVILINKASELRRRTKNWGIHAKQEEIEVDFKELIVRNVSRPMRILFTEPIVLLITLYMSFICTSHSPHPPNSSANVNANRRPSLPLPHRLRPRLPRRIRLVPRHIRPRLLRHGSRRNHRLHCHRPHKLALRQETRSKQQHPCSRVASPHQHAWRRAFRRRPVLVWMVWIHWKRALDRPRCIRLVYWFRHLQHFSVTAELPRRCVSHVRRVCYRGEYFHAKYFRGRVSSLCDVHV
jgi:DHA1 family multidrug resistance protein-like MFS transporter